HWIDGAPSNLVVVRVDPSIPKQATLESAPSPLSLTNGPPYTATARIRLRNVGAQPWAVGSERLTTAATPLSTSAWIDSTTPPALGSNASRPGQAKVYPGEVGEWLVPLSASRKPAGTYALSFRPQGYGPSVPLKVTVANVVLAASVTRASPSVNVPRAGSATSYFEVKNTGTIAWPIGGDLHSEVLARGGSPSRSSSWISATRPGGLGLNVTHPGATSVKPGEVGRFSVVLAGNNRAVGSASEQFGLVWEAWQNLGGFRVTLAYRIV
ncbi:MAG: hypothetical protein JWO12_2805, partial [Frankiales bacterium]|nr:hypothetical protein [Frankiales bacterium]